MCMHATRRKDKLLVHCSVQQTHINENVSACLTSVKIAFLNLNVSNITCSPGSKQPILWAQQLGHSCSALQINHQALGIFVQ